MRLITIINLRSTYINLKNQTSYHITIRNLHSMLNENNALVNGKFMQNMVAESMLRNGRQWFMAPRQQWWSTSIRLVICGDG